MEARGPQARILLQGLTQEVQVGIHQALALARAAAETVTFQGSTDGIGVQDQFGGNGADLPVFGMKEVTDLSDLFSRNHAAPQGKGFTQRPRRPQI